jgi:hypothetical protein
VFHLEYLGNPGQQAQRQVQIAKQLVSRCAQDIGELVKAGLPLEIQQSLDIVRVVGNNQVHPGILDVRDDPEMPSIFLS